MQRESFLISKSLTLQNVTFATFETLGGMQEGCSGDLEGQGGMQEQIHKNTKNHGSMRRVIAAHKKYIYFNDPVVPCV